MDKTKKLSIVVDVAQLEVIIGGLGMQITAKGGVHNLTAFRTLLALEPQLKSYPHLLRKIENAKKAADGQQLCFEAAYIT